MISMLDALENFICKEKRKMASRINFRNISTFRPLLDSLREPLEANKTNVVNHGNTADLWRKIFIFGCIPSLILCSIHVYLSEKPERPEFIPYEHLRIRTKKFPWGDGNHTLFHNPHTNALPDGYEQ